MMANPLKGEVDFEACGKSYTFRLGNAAQIAIEERLDMSIFDFLAMIEKEKRVKYIRLAMFYGLGQAVPEAEISDIIDDLKIQRVSEIIGESMALAFGTAEEKKSPLPVKIHGIGKAS